MRRTDERRGCARVLNVCTICVGPTATIVLIHNSIRAAAFGPLLLSLACGRTPTAPSPGLSTPAPQPTIDGAWQLTFQMTACSGERHCAFHIGTTREARLRVVSDGPRYNGVVDVYGEHVIVSGEMANGELVLSGRKAPAISGDRELEVTTLRLRLKEGATTGALEYTVRGMPAGAFIFGDVRHAGQIISAHRTEDASAFDQTRFGGSWRGRFAVRQCSWVGWLWCYPYQEDDVHFFTLDLSQAGNDVVGTLTINPTVIAVGGTVNGGVLELRGQSSRVISGGSEEVRLTAWSSRRDAAGSMSGTFAFELAWPGIGDGARLYSTTYRSVELVSTALIN